VNPFETIRMAVRALLRNKLRSFLTTLGIIIGVFAVIAMVAIGEGAKVQVEQTFASMGSNIVIVMPGTSTQGGAMGGMGSMPTLTWDDLKALRNEASALKAVAVQMRTAAQVQSDDQNWTTSIIGSSPEIFEIRSWTIEDGLPFTASDVDVGAKVAVVGRTVVDKLFGATADAVGHTIRIKGVPFQIVGVLSKKGQSAMGQDQDDQIFVPQTTWQSKIQGGLQKFIQGAIFASAVSAEATPRAEAQIKDILRDRHHIDVGMDDDFSVRNLSDMANAVESSTRVFTGLLASIAAISLLVGGIGIMNIMLVSVTERTREIGLRMAVGARRRHILAQFLVEALTLAVAGGIVGMVGGYYAAQALSQAFGWPMLFRVETVFLAVGFSAAVGIVFGIFPARKAAQLDPITALRYE
jgi:putative ABC transport system permease protein